MQVNRKYVFTVDQLELIRRLRNSGLTKDQVLTAYDSFERLDNHVGTSINIPMTLQALQAQALQRLVLTVPNTVGMTTNFLPLQDNQLQQLQLSKQLLSQQQFSQQQLSLVQLSQQQISQQPLHQQHFPQQQLSQQPLLQPQLSQPAQQRQQLMMLQQQLLQKLSQSSVVESPQNLVPQNLLLSSNQAQQQPQEEPLMMLRSISDQDNITDNSSNSEDRAMETGEEGEIDSDELKEFISQGDVSCLEEIKDFILKHNVKQQQIAILAGVSQPYVSRYLRADFNSMSERSCRAIKKWYLAYRRNPMAIGAAANSALSMSSPGGGSPTLKKLIASSQAASIDLTTFISAPPSTVNTELDFLSCPRRERFVFRPNHLQILESFFVEDNYPHYDRRDDIAKACNESTKELVGRELIDKEKVSVQIVSNWFANKRKDLKKLYKEEGFDASQLPMRSRGRPAHSYLDSSSSSALLQSIFDHQNSQMGHLLQRNGSHALLHQLSNEQLKSENNEATSDSAAKSSFRLSRNSEVDEAAELQFSVEIAAVNQAIMSLTGQKPIGIKMEKPDLTEYLVAAGGGARSRLSSGACVAADTS